jgi:CheY-like chemotaxis protein
VSNRILLIDDESNLLQALRRNLRGRFDITTANGGRAGIEEMERHGPFAMVVSDMQMPDVDGIRVLTTAKRLAPDTVRVMLTGNADQQTAINAVNDGSIFRFLSKPCPAEQLAVVLEEGLRHYQVMLAERELLSKTLAGCVSLINDLLSVANPKGFGRGGRMRQWMKQICCKLYLTDAWQYEVAAMLSQVGSIGHVFPDTEARSLEDREAILRNQAAASSAMLAKIPRLETIAAMIGSQYTPTKGNHVPFEVELGGKLIRMLTDFDIHCETVKSSHAIRLLQDHKDPYDPEALEAFAGLVMGGQQIKSLPIADLLEGMVLVNDVLTTSGEILLSNGHELTSTMIQRLKSFVRNSIPVTEPIVVRIHTIR